MASGLIARTPKAHAVATKPVPTAESKEALESKAHAALARAAERVARSKQETKLVDIVPGPCRRSSEWLCYHVCAYIYSDGSTETTTLLPGSEIYETFVASDIRNDYRKHFYDLHAHAKTNRWHQTYDKSRTKQQKAEEAKARAAEGKRAVTRARVFTSARSGTASAAAKIKAIKVLPRDKPAPRLGAIGGRTFQSSISKHRRKRLQRTTDPHGFVVGNRVFKIDGPANVPIDDIKSLFFASCEQSSFPLVPIRIEDEEVKATASYISCGEFTVTKALTRAEALLAFHKVLYTMTVKLGTPYEFANAGSCNIATKAQLPGRVNLQKLGHLCMCGDIEFQHESKRFQGLIMRPGGQFNLSGEPGKGAKLLFFAGGSIIGVGFRTDAMRELADRVLVWFFSVKVWDLIRE